MTYNEQPINSKNIMKKNTKKITQIKNNKYAKETDYLLKSSANAKRLRNVSTCFEPASY